MAQHQGAQPPAPTQERGDLDHAVDGGVLADLDAAKPLMIVDGPFLGTHDRRGRQHSGDRRAHSVGVVLHGDPGAVQQAAIIGGKTRRIDERLKVFSSLSHGPHPQGRVRDRTLARRRDRGCKRRGGFAGTRLQDGQGPAEAGRKTIRSALGAAPQAFEMASRGAGRSNACRSHSQPKALWPVGKETLMTPSQRSPLRLKWSR